MGGEGSIMAMRVALRNNNNQLKKKSYFNSTSKQGAIKRKHHLNITNSFSAEEQTVFRNRLKKERRAEDIKIGLIFAVLVVIIAVVFVYFYY